MTIEPITRLSPGQFFIPGLVDCHFHAVQVPNIGLGYDATLLEWLEKYTFPLEKKFSDNELAEKIFDAVVVRKSIVCQRVLFVNLERYYQHCYKMMRVNI